MNASVNFKELEVDADTFNLIYEMGKADERKHIISLMDSTFDMNGKIKILMDYIIGAELKWEYVGKSQEN